MTNSEPWILNLNGCMVSQVCFGWLVTLHMERAGVRYELQVEAPFVLVKGGVDSLQIDPEGSPDLLAPLLNLVRRQVLRADASEDGRLDLALAGNYEMRIPAGDKYESWTLVGSDGLRVVSMPNAQLATWRRKTKQDQADHKKLPE